MIKIERNKKKLKQTLKYYILSALFFSIFIGIKTVKADITFNGFVIDDNEQYHYSPLTTSISELITVPTDMTNPSLICFISEENWQKGITSVQFGGDELTEIWSTYNGSNRYEYFWWIKNPKQGSYNLTFTKQNYRNNIVHLNCRAIQGVGDIGNILTQGDFTGTQTSPYEHTYQTSDFATDSLLLAWGYFQNTPTSTQGTFFSLLEDDRKKETIYQTVGNNNNRVSWTWSGNNYYGTSKIIELKKAETGEGGGTPATSTPITSDFDVKEYRAYPTNAYTVSNTPLSDYFMKKRGYNSSIYYMPSETDTWYDSANSTTFDKIRIRMTFSGTATNTTTRTRVIVDQLDKNYNIIEKDWSWYEYNTTNLIANGWNSVLKDLEPPTEEWTATSTNANKEYNYAITFYDVDNKKTIKTIMINVIKAPSTWYDQPTESDFNQFDKWENIFGTSTQYTACTADEWENGNWWTSIKCNTFKTILDIIQSIITGVKTTVNGFINIVKNIFPFNFITKIVNCWNESKLIPRNGNLNNILDENNNVYISIPHEWTGNATDTTMIVFGEEITNENEKVNTIFTTIRYLSGPFMWFIFLFGLYYRIKNMIEEIKNNNKE